jgi:ABC-type transport system involved in multi-copper enzyme maturation permease subunit
MMLWYKAWLETRVRFLVSLFAIVGICAYRVLYLNTLGNWPSPDTWYYVVLQQTHGILATWWVLTVSLLMMGGLLQEVAVGASDFTLAFPVSRARLVMTRFGMGFAQSIALVVIPWAVMFLIDSYVGKGNSIGNAIFHVLLLATGGTVFVAWGLLVSSLVPGAYSATAVNLGVLLTVAMTMGDPPLNEWSPYRLMTGASWVNQHTGMIDGPLPWLRLAITIAIAASLTWVAIKAVQRKEF